MEELLVLGIHLCSFLSWLSVAYLCQGACGGEQWDHHKAGWSRLPMRPNSVNWVLPASCSLQLLQNTEEAEYCWRCEQDAALVLYSCVVWYLHKALQFPVRSASCWVGTALCWYYAVNYTCLECMESILGVERTSTSEVRASFIPPCVYSQP